MVATLGGEHAELLRQVELFRGLDRVTLAKLAAHLVPVTVTPGQIVFKQGDPPDGLYLVSRGTVAIYATAVDGSDEVVFGTLRQGEAFGEIALLTGDSRSATARAEEDGELLRLDPWPHRLVPGHIGWSDPPIAWCRCCSTRLAAECR